MDELKIEIRIETEDKLTEDQKQAILEDVRGCVGKYINKLPEPIGVKKFRIFKHFTDEELADALLK